MVCCRLIWHARSLSALSVQSPSGTTSDGNEASTYKESRAMNTSTMTNDVHEISAEALQGLGGGKLAYVKTIRSEDVQKHFPQAPELAAGTLLYALHAADGTPIMLTDSREAAIANAWSNELEAVSVH